MFLHERCDIVSYLNTKRTPCYAVMVSRAQNLTVVIKYYIYKI